MNDTLATKVAALVIAERPDVDFCQLTIGTRRKLTPEIIRVIPGPDEVPAGEASLGWGGPVPQPQSL